jgi:branched-chain amino acid transport system ATP-binding protein
MAGKEESMKALSARSVSLRFGGVQALSDVTIEMDTGERRLIIGPNGAGKTTFFNVVSGILRASAGKVEVYGADVGALSTHQRARLGIARTFQVINIFRGLSAFDNLLLALQARERIGIVPHRPMDSYVSLTEEAHALLKSWGLSADAHRIVAELSYGAQREIDLLLAMSSAPRLLLLDEPLSGLSAGESARIVALIRELPRDMAVLMIEHDMNVALDLADKVTVLHQGAMIAEGTRDEIRRHPRVNEIYLGVE